MVKTRSLNYPCLEHIFMLPKVFEPLKFYGIVIEFSMLNLKGHIGGSFTAAIYTLPITLSLRKTDTEYMSHDCH